MAGKRTLSNTTRMHACIYNHQKERPIHTHVVVVVVVLGQIANVAMAGHDGLVRGQVAVG